MSLPPIANLMGHWRCNDNAANTAVKDSSGLGRDMVCSVNTSIIATTGKINGAFTDLKTGPRTIIREGATEINAYPFSMSLWFLQNGSPTNAVCFVQIGDKDVANDYCNFILNVWESNKIALGIKNVADAECIYSSVGFADNAWHHAVAIFGSSTDRRVYVDNAIRNEMTGVKDLALTGNFDRWSIGYASDSTPGYYIESTTKVDDVRFYNIALSEAQRASLYNGGVGTEIESLPWIGSAPLPGNVVR